MNRWIRVLVCLLVIFSFGCAVGYASDERQTWECLYSAIFGYALGRLLYDEELWK